MAKYLSIFLVFLTICVCYAKLPLTQEDVRAAENGDDEAKFKVATSLVDRIIDLALAKLKAKLVEPFLLQDEVVLFNKSIFIIPLKGELALYDGKLWGVRSIARSGDAHFTYHNLHDVDVNCSFYFEELDFKYNFEANVFNKVSTHGKVNGNIRQLLADASLDLDFKNQSIELTSLSLKSAQSVNVDLQSEKYVDKVINFMIRIFTKNFKLKILHEIEKQLQSLLKQKFYY